MEYVEGITLKTYIEKKGQLNFKEAISIAIQVGRGIEAAHNKGIIHRDIKPAKVDFPDPVEPSIAIFSPSLTLIDTFLRTSSFS